MIERSEPYGLQTVPRARRQSGEVLPESVSAAAWEFACGPLLQDPQRVGKPLVGPLQGTWAARRGTYGLLYTIDDEARVVALRDTSRRTT